MPMQLPMHCPCNYVSTRSMYPTNLKLYPWIFWSCQFLIMVPRSIISSSITFSFSQLCSEKIGIECLKKSSWAVEPAINLFYSSGLSASSGVNMQLIESLFLKYRGMAVWSVLKEGSCLQLSLTNMISWFRERWRCNPGGRSHDILWRSGRGSIGCGNSELISSWRSIIYIPVHYCIII